MREKSIIAIAITAIILSVAAITSTVFMKPSATADGGAVDKKLDYLYNIINGTYNNLNILRNEVLLFERHYLEYRNETRSNLDALEQNITALQAQLEELKNQ